jgi:hypothetical protein
MTQDGMPATTTHPSWCDPTTCTVADSWPYGAHQSASHVVTADPPVTVVAELHLASAMPGLAPDTLLLLEFGVDEAATIVPLTLHQARELHVALDKLLAASARGPVKGPH